MRRSPMKRMPSRQGAQFWKELRQAVLEANVLHQQANGDPDAEDPRCDCNAARCPHPSKDRCTRRGTSLDIAHIEPLMMGGSRYDSRNVRNKVHNLRAMCRLCHRHEELNR